MYCRCLRLPPRAFWLCKCLAAFPLSGLTAVRRDVPLPLPLPFALPMRGMMLGHQRTHAAHTKSTESNRKVSSTATPSAHSTGRGKRGNNTPEFARTRRQDSARFQKLVMMHDRRRCKWDDSMTRRAPSAHCLQWLPIAIAVCCSRSLPLRCVPVSQNGCHDALYAVSHCACRRGDWCCGSPRWCARNVFDGLRGDRQHRGGARP